MSKSSEPQAPDAAPAVPGLRSDPQPRSEGEPLYRALFDAAPEALLVWDGNGVIQTGNARAPALLGYAKVEEMIGKSAMDFIAPEDRKVVSEAIEAAVRSGTPMDREFSMNRRDGGVFYAHVRVAPVYGSGGAVSCMIGSARDVSHRKLVEDALRAYRGMLATAESVAQVGSWEWDVARDVHIWSDEQFRILGRQPTQAPVTLQDFLACVHPEDRQRVEADALGVLANARPVDIEFRCLRPNGEVRILHSRKHVDRNTDGKPFRVVTTVQDMTDTRERERQLAELQANLMRTVAKLERGQREAVLLTELNETMQACNTQNEAYPLVADAAERLFPETSGALAIFSSENGELRTCAEWGKGRFMKPGFVIDDCWSLRRGRLHEVEQAGKGALCRHFTSAPPHAYLCLPLEVRGEILGLLHLGADAEERIEEDRIQLFVTFGEAVKLSLSNLKLHEVLRDEAIHDPLTGLYNRRYLLETIQREIRRAKRYKTPLAVAMLDIDHFKSINDTYGHHVGDEILRELSKMLTNCIRDTDVVSRFGGEEFVLVFPGAGANAMLPRLNDIAAQLRSRTYEVGGANVPAVTASIGLAEMPPRAVSAEELLGAADDALYVAKKNGRNRIEAFDWIRTPEPSGRTGQDEPPAAADKPEQQVDASAAAAPDR